MAERLPFSLAGIELPHPSYSDAPSIVVCTLAPSAENVKPCFICIESEDLKALLMRKILQEKDQTSPHPSTIELVAAYYTITFFERNAVASPSVSIQRHIIANDNWDNICWAGISLFEAGNGFLARTSHETSERFGVDELTKEFVGYGSVQYRNVEDEVLLYYVRCM